MKQIGGAIFVVLAIVGVGLAQTSVPAVPFSLSKETTAIVGPVKGDGTVDYVAAINELYGKGVTPNNNGYVIFLRAEGTDTLQTSIRAKTLAELGVAQQDFPEKGIDPDFPDGLPQRPWKGAEYPSAASYLAANDK